MGTPTNQVRERGETFFLKFLALNSSGPNTTNEAKEYRKRFNQVSQSTSKDAHIKAPRRLHTSKHPKGCTHQGTSKDARIKAPRRMNTPKHLEGCTHQSTSKDAQIKASRRMRKSEHLEGWEEKISKVASTRTNRRIRIERQPERRNNKPRKNIIHFENLCEGSVQTAKRKLQRITTGPA